MNLRRHPRVQDAETWFREHSARETVVLAGMAAWLLAEGGVPIPLVAGGAVAAVVTAAVLDELPELEQLQERRARGELTEAEFEDELELLLDERNQEIRQTVERVSGVGSETSAKIALRFESTDALADAGVADLREIHGVGDSTARAILRRVRT